MIYKMIQRHKPPKETLYPTNNAKKNTLARKHTHCYRGQAGIELPILRHRQDFVNLNVSLHK